MHIPRFHVNELRGPTVELPEAESRHAVLSLRLMERNEVEVFDGRGNVARGEIVAAVTTKRGKAARIVQVQIGEIRREAPPARPLTLIVAGCKGARLDWMIEKCTELGAARIVLADFERSVVHVRAAQADKLLRTAIEACKQCGRNWLPEIAAGMRMLDATGKKEGALLVCEPGPASKPLSAMVVKEPAAAVVIGPEGGLTESELTELERRGALRVRLADHILRVETAAVCAAAQFVT